MKKFMTRCILYLFSVGALCLLYLFIIIKKPYLVDEYYFRFTTPQAASLCLGTSRAAQCINPDVINRSLNLGEKRSLINHSFTVGTSPYGPNYLSEIKKKTKPDSQNGIFILCVDPRSLGADTSNREDKEELFIERDRFVGNLQSSSVNPNLEYLHKYWFNRIVPFEKIFKKLMGYSNQQRLHRNGWLEISVAMDSESVAKRKRFTLARSKKNTKKVAFSDTRLKYLEKMISFLQNKGQVYLVRLPVSKEAALIERETFPQFDQRIQQIAKKFSCPYFNIHIHSGAYQTTDGAHLYKKAGNLVSQHICDSIINYKSNFNTQRTQTSS